MRFLFSLLFFFSASAHATLTWQDLESEQTYQLNENILLEPGLLLLKGERFFLKEATPLGSLNVTMYEFEWPQCSLPGYNGEMVIHLPRQAPEGSEIGVQVSDCTVEVFVENKDFATFSVFDY